MISFCLQWSKQKDSDEILICSRFVGGLGSLVFCFSGKSGNRMFDCYPYNFAKQARPTLEPPARFRIGLCTLLNISAAALHPGIGKSIALAIRSAPIDGRGSCVVSEFIPPFWPSMAEIERPLAALREDGEGVLLMLAHCLVDVFPPGAHFMVRCFAHSTHCVARMDA